MKGSGLKAICIALTITLGGLAHAQDGPVTIMQIQGDGQFSPLRRQGVEATGVVTALASNGQHFWMQDPVGDGDPATSDGILVSHRARLAVGDLVRVVARVDEQQFGQALPVTRLVDVDELETLSSGHPLPAPQAITNLPDESLQDSIVFWEALEGMRVMLEEAPVVAPTSRFGEFVALAPADARPGSGYFPRVNLMVLRDLGLNRVDYNPERILVDDRVISTPQVRPGDVVVQLTGIVDYTFGAWKLQATDLDVVHALDPLPSPASWRLGQLGNTVITSFNLENLFDSENEPLKDDGDSTLSPADFDVKLDKLAKAVELELRLPHILIVQEAENQAVLEQLARRVNEGAGTAYEAFSLETSDSRGIEVGFLWDAERVTLVDAYQLTADAVEDAFGRTSPSPGREPLVGVFEINGRTLTIVGNHFKSKGGDNPPWGEESLAGERFSRFTEFQRKAQARAVRGFVNGLLREDGHALVMVTGDLNDFAFGEPGEGLDHPLAILEGVLTEVSLTNLVNFVEEADRYTFIFDGNSQVLDHMLVSPALLDLYAGVDILHFNAAFPAALSSDATTTVRASDHDPVEGRFRF